MRAKPKGIKRSLTKKKPSIPEKMDVSKFGGVVAYDEFAFVQLIRDTELLRSYPGLKKSTLLEVQDMLISNRMRKAVKDLDTRFFQRCAEVIERLRESKHADPMGFKILAVLDSLAKICVDGATISSPQVVKELEDRYPREDGQVYVEKDVREVALGLGLRFPVNADEIRRCTREYYRTRFTTSLGGEKEI